MNDDGPAATHPEQIIVSTMKIDPAQYALQTNSNRFQATLYALAGLLYLMRRQRSMLWLLATTLLCLGLALWLQVPLALLIELFMALGLVWITESINTAIEAAVDVASPQYHPMAKVSKDVAAAATLIAILLAGTISLLVLLPPLVERIF